MKIAVMGAVLAASIACAPLAQADNDQYDQYMISHGMVGSGSGQYSLEYLLQSGNNECAAFREGKSDTFLIGQLESQMGRAQAENIVFAAHHYLCP